jgi:hypothetical protein
MQHLEERINVLNMNIIGLEMHIKDGMQSLPYLKSSQPRSPLSSTAMS